ncbi:MAG: hemolysin [Rhodocyclales bacterium]|nr:hemolysin [Rhodocyclales bacterium]MDB5887711.1 hemolysin [Rhodocyclales bacterium]
MSKRMQSPLEEFANSSSHWLGFAAALGAAPVLIVVAAREGDAANIVGVSIFAASMVLLYLCSALYHALPQGAPKHFFHKLDHAAIYILIAGTYTPFTLGVLSGAWGWTLFGLIWAMAAMGLLLKAFDGLSNRYVSVGLYLLMGWLIVVAAVPLISKVPTQGLLWLLAGGLAYTGGVVFYVLSSRLRFGHFIWHLFVMAGTVCHFFAVLWYSA